MRTRPRGLMRPITGLRDLRLAAWFMAWLIGGVSVTLVFLPVYMAATDPDLAFGPALSAWFANGAFIAVLPGVFLWALYLGPVWLILRVWIARQGDRVIGPRPATLPVWITIWVGFVVTQVVLAGEDNLTGPPGALALIPAPFDMLFNGILLVQMAGVTVMFAVYRRSRPRDRAMAGPVTSSR